MVLRPKLATYWILCLAVCGALLADDWRDKSADQWNDEDVREVLTDSPWAKQVKIRYLEVPRSGQTGIPGTFPPGSPGGTPPIGIPGGGGPTGPGPGGVRTASQVLVQWHSATPIRLALEKEGRRQAVTSEQAENSHVIAVVGVPEMIGGSGDWSDSRTLERIQQGSRLFVGNNRSVLPSQVKTIENDEGLTVLYFFDRSDLPSLDGQKVKLLARVGAAQISAEFKTKDMKFNGQLDL